MMSWIGAFMSVIYARPLPEAISTPPIIITCNALPHGISCAINSKYHSKLCYYLYIFKRKLLLVFKVSLLFSSLGNKMTRYWLATTVNINFTNIGAVLFTDTIARLLLHWRNVQIPCSTHMLSITNSSLHINNLFILDDKQIVLSGK